MKKLILCADDFALHQAASRAIAQLAESGRISATSVMTLSPRWSQDAALLQPFRARIEVGLHLDWTSDFARRAGHGMSLGAAMRKAALGGFDMFQARQLIAQQLTAFEDQWQAAPDFVDGHQHVQQFAGIREALVAVLAERYPDNRPYLRISRVVAGRFNFKSQIITAMGADAMQKLAHVAHIKTSPALLGVYNFSGDGELYGRRMAQWLRSAPPGAIIMCHPALPGEIADPIARAREQEFGYLSSDDFAQALDQAGVELDPWPR